MKVRKEYPIKCDTTENMHDKIKQKLIALEGLYSILSYSLEIYDDNYNLLTVTVHTKD
jgi:hypothetical protein